jgi:hypothetical protein
MLFRALFESGCETLSRLVLDVAVTISQMNLVVDLNSWVGLAIFNFFLVKLHFLVDSLQDITVKYHDPVEPTVRIQAARAVGALEIVRETIFDRMILVKGKLVHYIRGLFVSTFEMQVIRDREHFLIRSSRLILLL